MINPSLEDGRSVIGEKSVNDGEGNADEEDLFIFKKQSPLE